MQDTANRSQSGSPDTERLAQQAADCFVQAFGRHPGFRLAHAKGLVCEGTFEPSKTAASLSRAAHFKGRSVPVVARFSNPTGLPNIPDGDANAVPKGLAVRFKLPDGGVTDIVSNGQPGFVTGTPADFVEFFSAALATKPDNPKPTPLDKFLAAHPETATHLARPNPMPASFATYAYFGNNAFVFVNAQGQRQAVRYRIVPVAGERHLDTATAAGKSPDFLFDEIKQRIAKAPVEFRLLAQLAEKNDPTSDVTKLWPEDRRKVELGIIRLTAVDPKSAETEKAIIYDPVHLTDGIELSDDPLPLFRSQVYAISYSHRHAD